MYIRTRDEALDAVAEILNLPGRPSQIVQSSVKIMLCLDAEQREFMGDCQALLLEGGLDALRAKRRNVLEGQDLVPLIVVDAEESRLFEEVSSAMDALRLSDVVRHVFSDLRQDRWQIARAMMARESDLKYQVVAAIKFRHRAGVYRDARATVDQLIAGQRPIWFDRAGTIRAICVDILKRAGTEDRSAMHEEADHLFQLIALSDTRAMKLLAWFDADPELAFHEVTRVREMVEAIRAAETRKSPGVRQVA